MNGSLLDCWQHSGSFFMNLFFKRDEEVRVLDMEFARSSEWVGHVHVCNNNSFSLIKTLDLPSIESRGERVSADGLGDLPVPPPLNFHPSIPGSRPWAPCGARTGGWSRFWKRCYLLGVVRQLRCRPGELPREPWRPGNWWTGKGTVETPGNLHFILLTTSFPRKPWKSNVKTEK